MTSATTVLPDRLTPLSEGEARVALVRALGRLGATSSPDVVALLMAQSALETGRWGRLHHFNFGNIKAGGSWDGAATTFSCGEVVDGVPRVLPEGDPRCFFRAYETPEDGAVDYLRLLFRKVHWREGLLSGDPLEFNAALSTRDPERGIFPYYSADPKRYGQQLFALTNQFRVSSGLPPLLKPPHQVVPFVLVAAAAAYLFWRLS